MSRNDSTTRNPRNEKAAQRDGLNHEFIVNYTQNYNELRPKRVVVAAVDEVGSKAHEVLA